jgi:hypothetical protein
VLLALAVALSVGVVSVGGASARPTGAEACTFVGGFAAFREAVGEKIVGACEDDQSFEQGMNARQRTTTGSFYFDAQRNQVVFRSGMRTWMSGATGIGHEVTVSGLGDETGSADPLVAPAGAVLNLALLQPGNLGPRWTDQMVPRQMPDFTEPDCSTLPDEFGLPSVQSGIFDQEHGRWAIHKVSAVPDWAVQPLRPQLERFTAVCEGWPAGVGASAEAPHFSLAPLLSLGEESLALKVELVQQGVGARHVAMFGFVRYGGLTSAMMVDSIHEQPEDELRAALEWLVNRADARLRDAARVLKA